MKRTAAQLVIGLLVFILVGWGLGKLWISIGGSADLDAIRDVAQARTTTQINIAKLVTWLGSTIVLVPLAAVCCLVFERRGLRRQAFAVAISLGGAMAIWGAIKPLVGRPRPPVQHLQHVGGLSFPSGHATSASAFWFSLVLALPAAGASRLQTGLAGVVAALIVLAVCVSRVVLGVHYPGDVVAGALLGTSWAVFVSVRLKRATRG